MNFIKESSPLRVILKLSGEALGMRGRRENIVPETVNFIAKEIKDAHLKGIEIAIVIGGGNFWRGATAAAKGMDRSTADYVGMLATMMNAIALQNVLEMMEVPCVVQSAIEMNQVVEPFSRRRAIQHLSEKNIVIFAAGTGNPFFSTDTAASLRANEVGACRILKATNVDGVYDSNPKENPNAKKFEKITFHECLMKKLRVMDSTAFSLCMDNNVPLVVFNISKERNIYRALIGESVGTLIINEE